MTSRIPLLLSPALLLAACVGGGGGDGVHTPTLAEISAEADGVVSVVDRDAELAGASEAEAGPELDLSGVGAAFRMQLEQEDLGRELETRTPPDAGGDEVPAAPATYQAVTTAVLAVGVADLATVLVVGPPAAAINIALNGAILQLDDRLWSATNTVTSADGLSVTANFNVAWVGVGWLAEMRISSSDGRYNDTLWFNGFVSVDNGVGWWDLYSEGQLVGVVEWVADGQGNGEAAIGATAGDIAGDLLYFLSFEGEDRVGYYDASAAFESYVHVDPDRSGEVVLLDRNGNLPQCWDSEYADVACE